MTWLYSDQLDRIEDMLILLTSNTNKGFKKMDLDFTKVTNAVTEQTSIEKSVETLLTQFAGEVTALKAQVAAAPTLADAQAKIDAFAQSISDNNTALQKAVTSNSKDFTPSGN